MKYEINRITKSNRDYLEVRKDGLFETSFTIFSDGWTARTYEEAFELAQNWIKVDLEQPTKTTVYTYEA